MSGYVEREWDLSEEFTLIVVQEEAECDYFEDLDEAIKAADSVNPDEPFCSLWTIVDGDDGMYVSEGNRTVNSMHMWIVTKRPHDFQGNEIVWHMYEE